MLSGRQADITIDDREDSGSRIDDDINMVRRQQQNSSSNNKRYIKRLLLHNFRNYTNADIDVGNNSVVLIGHNGAGKTNILEAISLLTPGRGMRGAKLSHIARTGAEQQGWAVSANIAATDSDHSKNSETYQVGTGVVPSSNNSSSGNNSIGYQENEKRIVKINGEIKKSQNVLPLYFSATWLTPQMGQIFIEPMSGRRRFFDRLVYNFDAEHASRVYAYEHNLREYNKLLSDFSTDKAWLKIMEEKLAAYSVAIAAARIQLLEQLAVAATDRKTTSNFIQASITLEGDAETPLLQNISAIDVEHMIAEKLTASRQENARAGRISSGAHKTQIHVYPKGRNIEAAHCSTGEQKALLISIILTHARARAAWHGSAPVLLLDEIVAHLDKTRRRELFSEIESIGAQAWLTGTDAADFSAANNIAKFLTVNNGEIIL